MRSSPITSVFGYTSVGSHHMDSDLSYDDSEDSGNESTDVSDGKYDACAGLENEDDEDGANVLHMHGLVASDCSIKSNKSDFMGTEDYQFEVLSTDQLVAQMDNYIQEVNEIVQLPPTVTRILLNHFNWDKDKLLERYYDGDVVKLFEEARIIDPSLDSSAQAYVPYSSSQVTSETKSKSSPCPPETCIICCRDFTSRDMTGIACGHRFCKDCWSCYLTTKIMEEGMGHRISCPAHLCEILVDDLTVMTLVVDSKVKAKYQHLITNSFVECNRFLRWCPKPECQHVIKVSSPGMAPVKCSCGSIFCFLCGGNWHDPVKCDLLRRWNKKLDDDSETSNWIAANTKECPKCNATIEKDGGCNHMICKNQTCRTEFCWVCLGPWDPHGSSWYSCNRFDEDEAKAARDAQEQSRAALQRYLFYCNRFMNHMQSLRFDNQLYATVKTSMEEMQQHNMSWIEVQFLQKAVDVLCQCRQTLMYTYVFAYYLARNNQSTIFQNNQSDLESAVESLSEYLERDMSKENVSDIKQRVQDKYRYCESRCKVLLAHVIEGYEKDWWEYTINSNVKLPSSRR